MSRVDELIRAQCPDGVEFRGLLELADYVRGVTYTKSDEQSDGPVAVFRANNITLASNTLNLDDLKRVSGTVRVRDNQRLSAGDILMCAGSGSKEHVGKAAYISEDRSETFGGFMGVLRPGPGLAPRFLFHLITGVNFARYLGSALTSTTINNLNAGLMRGFRVPVPPLEVQLAVAQVLDAFTKAEAELEVELEAELAARQLQYAHHRNALLRLPEQQGVQWVPMGDVVEYTNGKAHERVVAADGDVPLATARFISRNGEANRFVRNEDVLTPAVEGDVALVLSDLPNGRALARTYYVDRDHSVAINQRIARLRVKDKDVLRPRFLFHIMNRNSGLLAHDNGSDQTHLSKGQVVGLPIPVPPLEDQDRIVAILEKLDAFVNELSSGLAAEISARRQQYEYYRDKILTFEEAVA